MMLVKSKTTRPNKVGIGLILYSLMIIVLGSFVIVDGFNQQLVFTNDHYEVVKIDIDLSYSENMVIFNGFLYQAVNEIISNITGGMNETGLTNLDENLSNYIIEYVYTNFENVQGVYHAGEEVFLLVLLGEDEDLIRSQAFDIAQVIYSIIDGKTEEGYSSPIKVFYLQIPIDPYIDSQEETRYANLFSNLLEAGDVPEYIFLYGSLRGVPDFGVCLSGVSNGVEFNISVEKALAGVRSLADKMFGSNSKVFVHLVDACGEVVPLSSQPYYMEYENNSLADDEAGSSSEANSNPKENGNKSYTIEDEEINLIPTNTMFAIAALLVIVIFVVIILLRKG